VVCNVKSALPVSQVGGHSEKKTAAYLMHRYTFPEVERNIPALNSPLGYLTQLALSSEWNLAVGNVAWLSLSTIWVRRGMRLDNLSAADLAIVSNRRAIQVK
jgi:hypothetical protein